MDPQTWGAGGGVWFALALVNAGLAEQKNRSRLRWFVVSLILGPLATALIVVWPRVERDWRNDPVMTLNIVRDARDRWILALGVALLAAFVLLLTGLITEQLALSLISFGFLVACTIAVSWLLLVKKQREQNGKQTLG
jgi:drug/metabolite transporter superfamily protein YnfA